MKTAFIVCTRSDSSRVPRKVFKYINGQPLILHLIKRLRATGIEVIIAAPVEQKDEFNFLRDHGVKLYFGSKDNPLERMQRAASHYDVDNIIRVTHDKVLIDSEILHLALADFITGGFDYLYSDKFTAGTGFEIIKKASLDNAYKEVKQAEHISYAVRAVTKNIQNFNVPIQYRSKHRLLLDYEEDFNVLELVFSQLGNDIDLLKTIHFLDNHEWISKINKMPLVTFYTCVYNGEKYLEECMSSVMNQSVFSESEYIIIDDHSKDKSPLLALNYKAQSDRIDFYRNPKNVGLSTSSNIALKVSRGEYIIRLDADDYFLDSNAVEQMIEHLIRTSSEVVYPDNQFQKGSENHHVGGTLFKTSAINHLKFKEGLRGFEGLDLWHRARKQLKISYIDKPLFYYRQHDESLSKNNLVERDSIKREIELEHGT